MKISKLFHWLYALVMLLPIFAIGSSILISTFNMSGKEETEIVYKYKSNEVNSANDLVVGNIYHYKVNINDIQLYTNILNCGSIYNIVGYSDTFIAFDNNSIFTIQKETNTGISIRQQGVSGVIGAIYSLNDYIFECDLVYKGINFQDDYSNYSITNFNVIEDIQTHNLNAQDIFYNSVNKVTESPLFSWAYNSFLVAPFAYIVSLFSMPANSPVVMLLSYWLAISIIWLVFDLIMYVPLLVHRWIDKGVIE